MLAAPEQVSCLCLWTSGLLAVSRGQRGSGLFWPWVADELRGTTGSEAAGWMYDLAAGAWKNEAMDRLCCRFLLCFGSDPGLCAVSVLSWRLFVVVFIVFFMCKREGLLPV